MATNFRVKIGLHTYIYRLGIPQRSGISQFRFQKFHSRWHCFVNFGPVTSGFKRLKGVHPVVDQQFSYVCLAAPLLDTAGISTGFCGAISRPTQFFTCSLGGHHC